MSDTELLERFFDYVGEVGIRIVEPNGKPVKLSYLRWSGLQLMASFSDDKELTFRDHLEGFFKKYKTKEEYKATTSFREWETEDDE